LLEHCNRKRYRVAILDSPLNLDPVRWLTDHFEQGGVLAKWGAIYYPWLRVPSPLADQRKPVIQAPPSGHVAGLYARTDLEIGVQHPPANGELRFVSAVDREVPDEVHANLNESGINVLRRFPGRGIRVWGARSLARQEGAIDPWRYIHARRLMSYIQRSVELAMQWTVFEPNDFSLQRTLVHMLTEFLNGIWRTGGLLGARAEEGFYVKCDASNNPQSVIDAGQIVCEVGVAIAAPMEFLIFEIRLSAGSVQVKET
jgi:phage tail sheath protein FI